MTRCFETYQPTGFRSHRLWVSSRDGERAGLTCDDGYDTSPPWTLSGTLLTHSDRVVCLREDDGHAACLSLRSVSYGDDSREWDSDCEVMATSRVTTEVAVQGMAVHGAEVCAWTAAGALHCADLLFASSEVANFRAVGTLAGVERVWPGARRGSLCARDGRGRVWCRGAWGPEVYDPADAERPPPHDAFAGGEALREVPALAGAEEMLWWSERESACAILARGGVACWGWNHRGAIADGDVIRRVTPSLVAAAPGAVSLSAGSRHACAALRDGRLVCWGENDHGQLGDGAGHDARGPVRVAALDDAVELAAGAEHTCARTAAGEVYCWGRFGCGWPGRPGVRGALRPLRVELPGPVVALRSLGAFACAELAAGGVRC